MAARTRYTRGRNRIDEYDKFIDSPDYEKLIDYCFDLPRMEEEMKVAILSKLEETKVAIALEDHKQQNTLVVKGIDQTENALNRRMMGLVGLLGLAGGVAISKIIDYLLR